MSQVLDRLDKMEIIEVQIFTRARKQKRIWKGTGSCLKKLKVDLSEQCAVPPFEAGI